MTTRSRYFGPLRPWVTDENWGKVLTVAASPVITEWHATGEDFTLMDADDHKSLLLEFEDRVVFVAVRVDENPTLARANRIHGSWLTVHRRGVLVGRLYAPIAESDYENACNQGIRAT